MDSTVTDSTVKTRSRSERSCRGRTAAIAIAAEAPQIATAPPVSSAKRHLRPKSRATASANRIVATTPATTSSTSGQPRRASISTEMRAPSSATPSRSTVRAVIEMPGAVFAPSSARKFSASPRSSAISIAGAP